MRGFANLIVHRRKGLSGFAVVEDTFLGQCVAEVYNPAFTADREKEIAEKISAALNDETEISEQDLGELEALAKRVEDRSEYGGGLIRSLVNMYRNVKMQPKKD